MSLKDAMRRMHDVKKQHTRETMLEDEEYLALCNEVDKAKHCACEAEDHDQRLAAQHDAEELTNALKRKAPIPGPI